MRWMPAWWCWTPHSSVLAVACLSPEDERAVLAGEGDTETIELRVADERVGQLRMRARGAPPEGALLRMVGTLIAQEVDRSRAPERASEAAVADFLSDLLSRKLTDRENILARARGAGLRPDRRRRGASSRAPGPSRPRRATGARACWPWPSAARARWSARRWRPRSSSGRRARCPTARPASRGRPARIASW